jgi:transposase-like protein
MTKQTRRKFSADFKAKVALEAIKNQKTLAELSQQYEVNAITIARWKAEFLERMAVIFSDDRSSSNVAENDNPQVEKLYAQIGQLKVELDFLKKSARKLGIPENEWRP